MPCAKDLGFFSADRAHVFARSARMPFQMGFPLALERIPAGFPSPAEDYMDRSLDLNEYLVDNAAATFMVRVGGDSMIGAGIRDGDILVVDRSKTAAPGQIVVAVLDGALTVKRLSRKNGRIVLASENPEYRAIEIGDEQELIIWGVVAGMVRKFS